jgi:hypothetical protein
MHSLHFYWGISLTYGALRIVGQKGKNLSNFEKVKVHQNSYQIFSKFHLFAREIFVRCSVRWPVWEDWIPQTHCFQHRLTLGSQRTLWSLLSVAGDFIGKWFCGELRFSLLFAGTSNRVQENQQLDIVIMYSSSSIPFAADLQVFGRGRFWIYAKAPLPSGQGTQYGMEIKCEQIICYFLRD